MDIHLPHTRMTLCLPEGDVAGMELGPSGNPDLAGVLVAPRDTGCVRKAAPQGSKGRSRHKEAAPGGGRWHNLQPLPPTALVGTGVLGRAVERDKGESGPPVKSLTYSLHSGGRRPCHSGRTAEGQVGSSGAEQGRDSFLARFGLPRPRPPRHVHSSRHPAHSSPRLAQRAIPSCPRRTTVGQHAANTQVSLSVLQSGATPLPCLSGAPPRTSPRGAPPKVTTDRASPTHIQVSAALIVMVTATHRASEEVLVFGVFP